MGTTTNETAATIDGEGRACGLYLGSLTVCESTRFRYSTSSHTARDGRKSWRQNVAKRVCLGCGHVSRVDVAPCVPRAMTTADAWARWWGIVDARD